MSDERTIINLVRHGQTPWNEQRRLQGNFDVNLNENGRKQAQELAEELKMSIAEGRLSKIDAIVSSPLLRSVETARIIAGALGITSFSVENGLREQSYGGYEGKTFGQAAELANEKGSDDWRLNPPGGESWIDFQTRVHQTIDRLKQDFRGKEILVVGHMGIFRGFETYWSSLPPEAVFERDMHSASVVGYRF